MLIASSSPSERPKSPSITVFWSADNSLALKVIPISYTIISSNGGEPQPNELGPYQKSMERLLPLAQTKSASTPTACGSTSATDERSAFRLHGSPASSAPHRSSANSSASAAAASTGKHSTKTSPSPASSPANPTRPPPTLQTKPSPPEIGGWPPPRHHSRGRVPSFRAICGRLGGSIPSSWILKPRKYEGPGTVSRERESGV